MTDIVTREVRSQLMARIRGRDTGPEIAVRKGLHALGFRYRLHPRCVPGRPDISFPRYRAVVFVHGCFWHGHDCHLFRLPTTRRKFWAGKIDRNRARDAQVQEELHAAGWRRLVIWECALRGRGSRGLETVLSEAANWLRGHECDGEIRGKT